MLIKRQYLLYAVQDCLSPRLRPPPIARLSRVTGRHGSSPVAVPRAGGGKRGRRRGVIEVGHRDARQAFLDRALDVPNKPFFLWRDERERRPGHLRPSSPA